MNSDLLKQTWSDLGPVIEAMEEIDWATNTEFVVDIYTACSTMLGKHREAQNTLRSIAKKQPDLEAVNAALEINSVHCEDYATALAANAKLPQSELHILRRVGMLHEAKRHRECITLLQQEMPNLSGTHQVHGSCVMQAALSGDRVMAQVPAIVPAAGLEAVIVAAELAMESCPPSGRLSVEHVVNVLGRLNAPSAAPLSAETALQVGPHRRWPTRHATTDCAARRGGPCVT